MGRTLIYGMALLALSACGPAKMGTRNDKPNPQVQGEARHDAATPAAPTAATPADPLTDPDQSHQGETVPAVTPSDTNTFDPALESSTTTCVTDTCNENYMTDAGKYVTEQSLRFEPRTRKLDIIFVLDTSASMRDEHSKISREIGNFIAKLSPDVSFRLGILLAHGPHTGAKGVRVGHLFARDAEGPVIDSEDVMQEVKRDSPLATEREQRQQAAHRISEMLKARLAELPIDRSRAQGEAGLLNIYKALSGASERAELQRARLLRDDAALLVVTVADEQDMCFNYGEPSLVTGLLATGNYDTPNDMRTERAAFDSNEICGRVANGQRLTPMHVFDAAKQAKGTLPFIFTGIHYISENLPPRTDKHAGDNEMGHGYLDVIKLSDGRAVDLSTEDFGKILAEIGEFSNFKMKYEDTFVIPGRIDGDRLDPESIGVLIKSANGATHPIAGENIRVRANRHSQKPEVIINYEALEFAYQRGWIDEGSKLIITYGYRDESSP